MNIDILNKAEELGYKIVETTSEGNGYPRNLKKAIIGFEDFEDAEHFAKENGGEIIELRKKAGQELWSRYGRRYNAFNLCNTYADDPNCEMYFCGDEERFTDNVKSLITALDDFDVIKAYMEDMTEIWDNFDSLGEDEFILVRDGKFEDVVEKDRMYFEYDSTYYSIGVVVLS